MLILKSTSRETQITTRLDDGTVSWVEIFPVLAAETITNEHGDWFLRLNEGPELFFPRDGRIEIS